MIIFIDESGDPGFKVSRGSSRYFVLSCLIFDDEKKMVQMNEDIINFRRLHKIPDNYEFKFNNLSKENRCAFLNNIKNNSFIISALIVDKGALISNEGMKIKNLNYEYLLGILLDKIITTDGIYDLRIDGSMTKNLKHVFKSRIRKYSSHKIKLHMHVLNSKNDLLIQVADMIAGSIAKNLSSNNDRSVYIDILRDHIVGEIVL